MVGKSLLLGPNQHDRKGLIVDGGAACLAETSVMATLRILWLPSISQAERRVALVLQLPPMPSTLHLVCPLSRIQHYILSMLCCQSFS
jgi:hypothetical protein